MEQFFRDDYAPSTDDVYVPINTVNRHNLDEYYMVKTWMLEHATGCGYINGFLSGIYLNPEDAVAFKLKFVTCLKH